MLHISWDSVLVRYLLTSCQSNFACFTWGQIELNVGYLEKLEKVIKFQKSSFLNFSNILGKKPASNNANFCILRVYSHLVKATVKAKKFKEQVCIQVGCIPPACCPYLPACTARGCTCPGWGVPGLGVGVYVVLRGCTWPGWRGVYLFPRRERCICPGGVPSPGECIWSRGLPAGGVPAQVLPLREQNDGQV